MLKAFKTHGALLVWIGLAVALVYLPVIGVRTLRFGGDEKSYLDQVIEMKDRSHWFVQTFFGEPCYYKGPFHYVAVRASWLLFGNTFWSALFPNFLLLLFGAWATGLALIRFHPSRRDWAFAAGTAFATCAGLYTHGLASQMEVELAGFFMIGMAALAWDQTLLFWLVAGSAGWIKSPLHSVLLGSAGLLYWGLQGSLIRRLKNPRQWFCVIAGILFSCAGYAPAFLGDHENFMKTYIYRETLDKPSNFSPWWTPILPVLTHSVFPWTLFVWVGLLSLIKRTIRRIQNPASVILGFSIAAPSIAFFLIHPYRVHTYNLPIIGALILISCGFGAGFPPIRSWVLRVSLASSPLFLALTTAGASYIVQRLGVPFVPLRLLNLCGICSAVSLGAMLLILFMRSWPLGKAAALAAIAAVPSFMVLGLLLRVFGTWEVESFNFQVNHLTRTGESPRILYYDPSKSVWHEWGLMVFATGHEIRPIYTADAVREALGRGDIVVTQNPNAPEFTRSPNHEQLDVLPWPRWRRPAEKTAGVPAWKSAWQHSDWKELIMDYGIVRLKKSL